MSFIFVLQIIEARPSEPFTGHTQGYEGSRLVGLESEWHSHSAFDLLGK